MALLLAWPCQAATSRVGLEPVATPLVVEIRAPLTPGALTPTPLTAPVTAALPSLALPEVLPETGASILAPGIIPDQSSILPSQIPTLALSKIPEQDQKPQPSVESGSAQGEATFDGSRPAAPDTAEPPSVPVDLNGLEYEQARTAVGIILRNHPPTRTYFLGVGRSPAILTAVLQNLDERLAGNLPLSEFYSHPAGLASFHPPLPADQEKALFDHLDRHIPPDVLEGKRTLVLLDLVKSGRSMVALDEYLKLFAARRHQQLRWQFVGLAYDEKHSGLEEVGWHYPLITPADLGADRRSILHARMSMSVNEDLAEYDLFPAPFTGSPAPRKPYAIWRAELARRMSRDPAAAALRALVGP